MYVCMYVQLINEANQVAIVPRQARAGWLAGLPIMTLGFPPLLLCSIIQMKHCRYRTLIIVSNEVNEVICINY